MTIKSTANRLVNGSSSGLLHCLQLLQRPDHLRLRMPALRHTHPPFLRPKSYSDLFGIRGAGQKSRRVGSKVETHRIRNGTGEKTFSSESAKPILIFCYGTSARELVRAWSLSTVFVQPQGVQNGEEEGDYSFTETHCCVMLEIPLSGGDKQLIPATVARALGTEYGFQFTALSADQRRQIRATLRERPTIPEHGVGQ